MSGNYSIRIRPAGPEDMPALLALSQVWAAEGITYGLGSREDYNNGPQTG